MSERTIQDLWQLQGLPLNLKIRMTKDRIRQWIQTYGEDGVYVSFSGGKDSTVLLDLVRQDWPNVPGMFVDTGLEFPEIRNFVRQHENIDWVKPKMNFKAVIQKYGYPFISKEVSECVYGARKYLTSVMEQNSIDRQTDSLRIGTDWTSSSDQVSTRMEEAQRYRTLADNRSLQKQIGGGTTTNTESSEDLDSIRLKEAIDKAPSQIIDNFRIQRLMGILPLTGKATMETIPSKGDRSAFSCARYQFFLDAPFEIGNQCCNVMKKSPGKAYQKRTGRVPMTAQMASESRLRTQIWLKQGCNAFDAKKPMSNPMAFWTEQDVLLYIYQNHLPICSVYGEVVKEQGQDGQMDLEDYFGKELFDLERPTLKTTGCNRTG